MDSTPWKSGDRARINERAFPGSNDPRDVAARGQAGVLLEEMDDGLWCWRGDDGTVTYPITAELERIDDSNLR